MAFVMSRVEYEEEVVKVLVLNCCSSRWCVVCVRRPTGGDETVPFFSNDPKSLPMNSSFILTLVFLLVHHCDYGDSKLDLVEW